MDFDRIVVGLDGSPAAAEAVHWAGQAVGETGEVVAVHAASRPLIAQAATSAATGLGMFPDVEGYREQARRALEGWCEPLRKAGVTYRALVSDDEPVRALLDIARGEKADLIVIGHQGDTGLLHRLVRGLSDHLIDHARRPVVVVPYDPSADNGK